MDNLTKFSRKAFLEETDAGQLADELAIIATKRYQVAAGANTEVGAIVRELNKGEHQLVPLGADDDNDTYWACDLSPTARRLTVTFGRGEDDEPWVLAWFRREMLCPSCCIPMEDGHGVTIDAQGHGSVLGPDAVLKVSFDRATVSKTIGLRSWKQYIPGFSCVRCSGVWVPDPKEHGAV